MDIQTTKPHFTTTVRLPIELRQVIANKGMTINGAFIRGLELIMNENNVNQELYELRENMNRYRNGFIKMKAMNDELRAKLNQDVSE